MLRPRGLQCFFSIGIFCTLHLSPCVTWHYEDVLCKRPVRRGIHFFVATELHADALAALHPSAREALCARFLVGRRPSVRCCLLHPSIARSYSGIPLPPQLPLLQSESSRHDGIPATAAATKLYLIRILSCRPDRQTNTPLEGTEDGNVAYFAPPRLQHASLNATRGHGMHRRSDAKQFIFRYRIV